MNTPQKIKKQPAISLQNLGKKYGSHTAVSGLSLEIKAGEICALTGPSGCGKTTTLRLIAGLERPDWGEIRLNGQQVSSPEKITAPNKRFVGMVFQDLALWPHMNVQHHVDFALHPKKYRGSARKKKIADILGLVRLEKNNSYPHQLSGGEQQRLALARTLAAEPRILLFDEPLSNLDFASKEELLYEIKTLLHTLHITALYVTHQPEETICIADRVATMATGAVVSTCSVHEFADQQQMFFSQRFQVPTQKKTDGKGKIIPLNVHNAG